MPIPLRVLIVEDDPPDAELMLRELRRGGYEPEHRVVASADGLRDALAVANWELILCDYTLAGFSGTDALAMVRQAQVDAPLIFVSGTMGEDIAVAAMRAGAQDYVLKENLKRLLPSIERELQEAALRRGAARAQAELAAAETRFQLLLDMAPDAIVTTDTEGRVGVYNRAAETLFGYRPEEIAGAPIGRLLPAGIPGGGAGHNPVQMRGLRSDGTAIPIEVSAGVVVEQGQAVTMAVIRDTRQRHELEAQLRQAQKMEVVGQLTGGLAHDFNNLLTVIVGNLEAIGQQLPTEQSRRMAELALAAGMRGATLTRQMLAFSRRQALESRPFDLNALVAGTIDLLRRTLGERVAVETGLTADLWTALADPAQVETALLNLALNARDAMPDGGTLRIETANVHLDAAYLVANPEAVEGDHVMISVSDTGIGIAPGELTRVFEPFYTTKSPGLGTGLGLSMVYGFVRQSGGHVRVESREGQGTRVRLYLPRAGGTPMAETVAAPVQAARSQQEAHVLLVEDDENVRATALSLLRAAGYRVTAAADGPSALSLMQDGLRPDLLFTDFAMPGGMSGLDLAVAARRLDPVLPVLLTTGYADIEADEAAERSGDSDLWRSVLNKPYRQSDLLAKVGETLAAGQQEQVGA